MRRARCSPPALVVVVWEAGQAFDLVDLPSGVLEALPATLDIRTALELDEAMYEAAAQLAQRGSESGRGGP